ncbi:GPS domain-containing protein, partial [Caerostris extrusa]
MTRPDFTDGVNCSGCFENEVIRLTICNMAMLESVNKQVSQSKATRLYAFQCHSIVMEITSRIIGVGLGDSNDTRLLPDEKSIKIILTHPPRPSQSAPGTVLMGWETEGCSVVRSEIDFTECECNHLTNFAILMDFAGPEFKPEDENVLNILSSVFCDLFSSRRNTITCNLAVCLLAMNILVQTGLKREATT